MNGGSGGECSFESKRSAALDDSVAYSGKFVSGICGERIDHLDPWTIVIGNVTANYRQILAARGGGNKAIGHWHWTSFCREFRFLLSPDGGDGGVEAKNSAFHGLDEAGERFPRLCGMASQYYTIFKGGGGRQLRNDRPNPPTRPNDPHHLWRATDKPPITVHYPLNKPGIRHLIVTILPPACHSRPACSLCNKKRL